MTTIIRYKNILFLLGVIILTGILSCKKHNLDDPDNITNRLFRPPTFSASVNANEVTLSWIPISNATYLLEVSKDNLVFETELQQVELGEINTYVLSDLWSSIRYSARIKAISKNPEIEDSEFTAVTFQTGVENIFYTPEEEDITTNSVLLGWDKSKKVTRITVAATGTSTKTLNLSASEIEDGEILVEELNPATTYTFRIYNNDMLRGTLAVEVGALALSAPVFINFGMDNTAAGWNNLTHIADAYPLPRGTIADLIAKDGKATDVNFVYVTAFGSSGARHTSGPTVTSIPDFEMPAGVSQQGFYGVNAGGGSAVFRFQGLRDGQEYDLCFFGSRMGQSNNQQTQYKVNGANEVIALLDTHNNDSQIACANAVIPDANGNITITVTKGPTNNNGSGVYTINALRLSLTE